MIYDGLVVLVVLGCAWIGARRGLASQLAGLLSLLGGFLVAVPLSARVAPLFGQRGPFNRLLALAVLYALVSLTLYGLAFRYRKAIEKWKLEHWDRHLGALMGAAKGFFLAIVLTFFALVLIEKVRDPILRTPSGRLMGRVLRTLHPVLPPEVHDVLHPYHHYLDDPPGRSAAPARPENPSVRKGSSP